MKLLIFASALLLITSASHSATLTLPLSEPCNITSSKVVPEFRGHDANAIIHELNKIHLTKDEYESKHEFNERVDKSLNSMSPAIADGSLCVVGANFVYGGNTKYDPESKTLWVYIFLEHPNVWVSNDDVHIDFLIMANHKELKHSSYAASNAFGASTEVSKTVRAGTYISFDRQETTVALKEAGVVEFENMYLAIPLHIAASSARSLDGAIRVGYRYKLRAPLLATTTSYETPTLTSPYDDKETKTLIVASLEGVIIFNNESGEVLRALDLTKAPNNGAPSY